MKKEKSRKMELMDERVAKRGESRHKTTFPALERIGDLVGCFSVYKRTDSEPIFPRFTHTHKDPVVDI